MNWRFQMVFKNGSANSFLNPDWNFKFTLDMFFEFGNCESGLDGNLYWTII